MEDRAEMERVSEHDIESILYRLRCHYDDTGWSIFMDATDFIERLQSLRAGRMAGMEHAIRNFLQKYGECEEHINAAFAFQLNHGIPYRGPSYEHELTALRSALSPSTGEE